MKDDIEYDDKVINPIHKEKVTVSGVKINNSIFILFILNYYKITTVLKPESVRSQESLLLIPSSICISAKLHQGIGI